MSDVWLNNNRVSFSIVDVKGKEVLVCTTVVARCTLKFVEDIHTGKRAFPSESQLDSDMQINDLIQLLALQLL